MKTIVIAQQKGGVGKSTLCQILATTLDQAGKKIEIVDLDPQQSLTSCMGLVGLESSKDASYRIIDTPPDITHRASNEAIKEADIVIIPTTTSIQDVLVTKSTIPLIKQQATGIVKIAWVKYQPNTTAGRQLDDYKIQMECDSLNQTIGNRECYRQDFLLSGWSGLNTEAKNESTAFTLEVVS